MPDVGLTTASEPLDPSYRVIIKYSIEVEGLPVYSETYDVRRIAEELAANEAQAAELWLRRIKCVVACRDQPAFSASVTRCLAKGCESQAGKSKAE